VRGEELAAEDPEPGRALGELAVLVAVAAAAGAALWRSNSAASATIVIAVVAAATVAMLVRGFEDEPDSVVRATIVVALVAKIAATAALIATAVDAFGHPGEERAIDRLAQSFADAIQGGTLAPAGGHAIVGQGAVELVTSYLYAAAGHTIAGAYVLFSWFGFVGCYLFLRAVRLAFPRARRRLYAAGIFLAPSLLLWSSQVGTPALALFGAGLASYGIARLYTFRRGGWFALATGLAVSAVVHPAVAAVIAAAGFVGLLTALPRSHGRARRMPAAPIVVVVLLTAVAAVAGGTATVAADLPGAVVSVLVRPVPGEAGTTGEWIAAVEGIVLVVLLVRALVALPSALRSRNGYLAYGLTAAGLLLLGVASFGAPATFTAARAEVLPFLLVVLAVPAIQTRGNGHRDPTPQLPRLRSSTVQVRQ
jgi:hypothetical protein